MANFSPAASEDDRSLGPRGLRCSLGLVVRRIVAVALLGAPTMAWSGADDFPIVPADIAVALYAREPLVRNPCAITFDRKGRLCVGMGPQYRNPTPQTEGDSVYILLDEDGDGVADRRKQFATGFNSIQGLAWKGRDLWVANAPDLTIARDLDGDDEADEYIRVYTDLGNLEHGLHGLNWAPDGKLYMSKGNSKGLTQAPARIAPKPFRELWGVTAPPGTPDFPAPETFRKGEYKANYHDPADDWGLTGGFLRCADGGSALEIVSRGLRNPWDIAYDEGFNWLGTDNDQTLGDKIIAPFFGAHFGWGHSWSHDWSGDRHLPTVPASGPLFEGSGTGITFCDVPIYPAKYRGVFLVNDWLKRQVYIYRPKWNGALRVPAEESFELLADAGSGRSMSSSTGRSFDPVDIEIGPDGAVWISSWGRQYGATMNEGGMANEGRIYRFRPKEIKPNAMVAARRNQPIEQWHSSELIDDLASHLPVWRIDAREELIRRGDSMIPLLEAALRNPRSTAHETWLAWTLGSLRMSEHAADDLFVAMAGDGPNINLRIQGLRILAHRARERGSGELPNVVRDGLEEREPRLRHEAVLAIHQAGETRWTEDLLSLVARETDRVVFYSAWRALRDLLDGPTRKALLQDKRAPVRRAAVLGLLEDDALTEAQLRTIALDTDAETSALATERLGGKAVTEVRGPTVGRSGKREMDDVPALEAIVSTVSKIAAPGGRTYREARLEVGQFAYTDRRYRLLDVPVELRGETFIQGANEDAEAEGHSALTLKLRYPSTVYLADDIRGGSLPAWAAARFKATDLEIRTSDAVHRIYRAELPAGEVTFGGNREGISARKANYLIVIQPNLLTPPAKPTTIADVAPMLAKGDPARGRALFFSKNGTGCASCHQLGGEGNAFAPDLSDLSARATGESILRSILEPSSEITEGFAMRVVTTRSGETYSGMLLEETAQAVKIGMAGGLTEMVPIKEIAKRETLAVSAMPGHFSVLLQPQDVADLAAYLLSGLKLSVARDDEQRLVSAIEAKPDALTGKSWGDERKGFFLKCANDRLEIALNGEPIATYYYRHPRLKRPFFAHLKTRGGLQVTRNFPPVKGQDPEDHVDLHPGLSLGFALLDGVNFWHNTAGSVVHESFGEEPRVGEMAAFSVRNSYLAPDGRVICHEEAHYQLTQNEDGWLIAMETRLSSEKPFSFGVKEEMGLALRVATPIRVKDGGGTILSRNGGVNEKETWGVPDRWWDYFGPIRQRSAGVQIMSGPDNPEVWAHSRDYGLLIANPFPVDRAENRGRTVVIKPEQVFSLRFGIQVHEHARREDFNPDRSYQRYLNAVEN